MADESLDRLKSLRVRLENFKSRGGLPAIKLVQGRLIGLSMFGGPSIIEPEETYAPMQFRLAAVQQSIDRILNSKNSMQQEAVNYDD